MAVLERLSEKDQKKYGGKWVAVKAGKVLIAADHPSKIVDWLKQRGVAAELVYRLPAENEPTNWVY